MCCSWLGNPGPREGHSYIEAGLFHGELCMLPPAGNPTALGLCSFICKMKGAAWMTVKAPHIQREYQDLFLETKVSSRRRRALCLEEWHEAMGLLPCCHHPFTTGFTVICLICQIHVILCASTSKGNEEVPAKKRSCLRQGLILFGTPNCPNWPGALGKLQMNP